MNQRVKLIIEYDGTNYVGWQNQRNQRSIQGEIEKSLKKVFNQTVIVYGAGRTDAGVHALKQVAHFDLDRLEISEKNFARVEFLLKKRKNQISILDSKIVKPTFHARFSVKNKTYLYKVFNRSTESFLIKNRSWFIPVNLNVEKMIQASKKLIGKFDFNAFRSSDCQAKNSVRSIEKIIIRKKKDFINFEISGRSFMHNQVRIIVGTLINIGKEILKINEIEDILKSKDRRMAGPTAPAWGLYLKKN